MERREQAEIDVHRLERRRLGVAGDVAQQRAQRGGGGQGLPVAPREFSGSHHARDQPNRRAFDIALAPGHLARKADMRRGAQAQLAVEHLRRIEEGVAVQAPQPRKLGILQPRNGAEQFDLRAIFQLGLEPDHVPQRAQLVVLPQLHHSIGPAPLREFGRGIEGVIQPHALHRAIAQRFHPAFRHHFDRHAAIEIGRVLFPLLEFGLFAFHQPLVKGEILLLRHRAVDVIAALVRSIGALVPARLDPALAHVDGVAVDDRGDGIEKRQPFSPGGLHDAGSQRLCGQRAGRDNGEASGGQGVHPLAHNGDIGVLAEHLFNLGRKHIAVHRHRAARRHPRNVPCAHHQTVKRAHLVVQQADRVFLVIIRTEGIGAHQFGQPIGLVRRGHFARSAHLRQAHPEPAPGQLPRRLAPGEPAANNVHIVICRYRGHGERRNCVIARLQAHWAGSARDCGKDGKTGTDRTTSVVAGEYRGGDGVLLPARQSGWRRHLGPVGQGRIGRAAGDLCAGARAA